MRIDFYSCNTDVIVLPVVLKAHLFVARQISSKGFLLPGHPGERKAGGYHNLRIRNAFRFELFCDGSQSHEVVVLITGFFCKELFVSFIEKIVPAVIDKHVFGKGWFGIIGQKTCAEHMACGLDVPVAMVDSDDDLVC